MSKIVYRFRSCLLDPRQRELWIDGRLVGLPLKSFDCLVYLVEHRDRAVGRDELIAAVWGRADINDHTLAQTLSRVRQVLRDVEAEAIRTMPRFGYRWVAPTERVEFDGGDETAEEGAAVAEPAPPPPLPAALDAGPVERAAAPASNAAPRRRRRAAIGALALAVLAIAAALLLPRSAERRAEPVVPPASAESKAAAGDTYLVMPVRVEAEAKDVAWMRLGVMDYIGVALKNGGERRVLPNDQILSLTAGTAPDARSEDADLSRLMALTGATHVVQAHARRTGSGWRVALDVFHGDTLRSYSGTAAVPLEAVHAALETMMRDLHPAGRLAPLSSQDETLQRIDVALLGGDLAQAQQLLSANEGQLGDDAAFRLRRGQVALRRGRLDEARQAFRALIDEASHGPHEWLPEAWLGLAGTELQRTDFAAAEAAYGEAIALLRGSGNTQLLGNAYAGRGASYSNHDRFEEAMADFGRARVALDSAGDRIGVARLEINVAAADAYRGRLAQALEAQDRSIRVFTAFGVREALLTALHNKIYVQFSLLDVPGALETSRQAFELAQPFDNERMRTRIAAARTRALLNAGQLTEAAGLLDRYAADDVAPVDPEFMLLRLDWLQQRGEYARIADLAMASLDRAEQSTGFAAQVAQMGICLAGVDAASRVRRLDVAERLIERLDAVSKPPSSDEQAALLGFSRAMLLYARGRRDEAHTLFATSMETVERVGEPSMIISLASIWLHYLIEQRDFETAASIAGRLRPHADKDYTAAHALAAYYRASDQKSLADVAEERLRALAGERDPALPL